MAIRLALKRMNGPLEGVAPRGSIIGQPVSVEERNPRLAFALAPLTAPLIWWVVFAARDVHGIADALGGLLLVIIASLPFTYGAALLLGLPLYVAIVRRSHLRMWHPITAGIVFGAMVFWLCTSMQGGLEAFAFGSILGGTSGTVFWLIWRCPTRRGSGPGSRLLPKAGP